MNGNVNALFQRVALITGEDALEKFQQTRVLVFGLGGVGSWAAEALARSGIGKIGVIDFDTIALGNVNRQIQATSRTIGQPKADVMRERLLEINPCCEAAAWNAVFSRDNAAQFNIKDADYVIDAIDTLNHKLDLIETCGAAGTPLYSSMGMALRLNPARIKIAGIWDTHGCPLARLVREGLRKRNWTGSFTAVYSDESPSPRMEKKQAEEGEAGGKIINGSMVTVTAAAGMTLASLVLCDIVGRR